MNDRNQTRLASVLTLLAGVWVAISPMWIPVTGAALTSVIVTGIVIALAGAIQFFWENVLPSWVGGLAAVWLFLSTFVYGVGTAAAWNQIISAIVTIILVYWDGFEVAQVERHHPGHA